MNYKFIGDFVGILLVLLFIFDVFQMIGTGFEPSTLVDQDKESGRWPSLHLGPSKVKQSFFKWAIHGIFYFIFVFSI